MPINTCLVLFNPATFTGNNVGRMFDIAREADALGIDKISVFDHVAMESGPEAEAESLKTGIPHEAEEAIYEPMCFLSAIAAVTKQIRLTHSILIGPLRSAILLAKQAATIDQFSGGRMELALGAGWQEAEYAASNVRFDRRFTILEEQTEACRLLWRQGGATFDGKFVNFKNLWSVPFPVQPSIPIWYGIGISDRNVKRIARYADGWLPHLAGLDYLRDGLDRIRFEAKAIGRDLSDFGVRGSPPPVHREDGSYDLDATLAQCPELIEAGMTEIALATCHTVTNEDELARGMKQLIELKQVYA